jgi:hypothetical protein
MADVFAVAAARGELAAAAAAARAPPPTAVKLFRTKAAPGEPVLCLLEVAPVGAHVRQALTLTLTLTLTLPCPAACRDACELRSLSRPRTSPRCSLRRMAGAGGVPAERDAQHQGRAALHGGGADGGGARPGISCIPLLLIYI